MSTKIYFKNGYLSFVNTTDKKVKKIAKNFSLLLKHHSISFRKLSRAIGITHPYLFRLSKGKHISPGFVTLEKITRFFQISIDQLIGEQKIDFKTRPKNLELDFEDE